MERILKNLFDYQRYQPNAQLGKLIEETRSRYSLVSDDDLELVSAAGDIYAEAARKPPEEHE